MGNKNKTISFRVNEDAFETLRELAEERDISLSSVFREYVDMLVKHDGKVRVVPEHVIDQDTTTGSDTFPPKVEVSKSFLREHERLELETEHLREQLDEYKQHVTSLRQRLEEVEDDEVVLLDDLDEEPEEETFHIGYDA